MTPSDAITDVPGIEVGHWTDAVAATGCTVVLCQAGATPGVDVRGGAPGTAETDALGPGRLVQQAHAIVFSGGSAFGLSTVDGVRRWCEERGIGLSFAGRTVPIAAGAILFDLNIGDGSVRPGPGQGYAAAASARDGPVEQGSVGAGTGATVAKMLRRGAVKGGIGTASEALAGGFVVGALVAVNAVGEVIDPTSGGVVAGARGADGAPVDLLEALRAGVSAPEAPGTTIGVVATNARLSKEQANRLAAVAHDGLARAVRPAHLLADGDAMFALATGAIDVAPERLPAIEAFAARCVERAIVKGVLAATSLAGVPAVRDLQG